MWQVKLTCGNLVHEYKYETEQAAEQVANAHRQTGYYEVTVSKV